MRKFLISLVSTSAVVFVGLMALLFIHLNEGTSSVSNADNPTTTSTSLKTYTTASTSTTRNSATKKGNPTTIKTTIRTTSRQETTSKKDAPVNTTNKATTATAVDIASSEKEAADQLAAAEKEAAEKAARKAAAIEAEYKRHEETVESIERNYQAKMAGKDGVISTYRNLMTGYYSESRYNQLQSEISQLRRKINLLSMGSGSAVEIASLNSQLASKENELRTMTGNKIWQEEIDKLEAEKQSLEQEMYTELEREENTHNSNLENIEFQYS